MSEERLNARRNWKAQTFPYDHFIPDNSPECQYCLTDKQAEILRGIIEPLGWTTRWWSDSDAIISQDAIMAFRDDLIRRLMMPCCDDDLIFRWTIDLVLESSDDGGTTWTPAPQDDPRINSPQYPPMSGADGNDKKCIAATGMAHLIKTQIADTMTEDMGVYDLQELIRDWTGLAINSGANIFQILITIAVNQILALGILAIQAALTEPVYDTLKCIFYCAMEEDASFTEAGLSEVTTEIGDQIGGIATLFLQQLINLLGVVGLTNLARSGGATTGDCEDCGECPDCDVLAVIPTGGGTLISFEDCLLTVSSQLSGGTHGVYVWFDNETGVFDPDKCGLVLSTNYLSGSADIGYSDCGTGTSHYPALFPGVPVSQFFLLSAVPFTVEILVSAP